MKRAVHWSREMPTGGARTYRTACAFRTAECETVTRDPTLATCEVCRALAAAYVINLLREAK